MDGGKSGGRGRTSNGGRKCHERLRNDGVYIMRVCVEGTIGIGCRDRNGIEKMLIRCLGMSFLGREDGRGKGLDGRILNWASGGGLQGVGEKDVMAKLAKVVVVDAECTYFLA